MFRIETEADQHRRQLVERRLEETNNRLSPVMRALRDTHKGEERPVQLYAFDEEDTLIGGLVGYAWGSWLHIDLLWVAAPHRGGGLGSRLVTGAEQRATELGCGHSRVETWDFQAPNFYRKLGYTVVGVIEDYPPGVTDHLLVKALS